MTDDLFLFWTICVGSLFLANVITNCFFPNPSKFLEAYGGCDCEENECKKIESIKYYGKMYTRVIQEDDPKMPYTYSKIYNVTQGKWAYDVGGEDDPKQVWADNEWEDDDALVGFYSTENEDFHNVIFCPLGYAIYVQAESDKDRANFNFNNEKYRIPPAILINLNNTSDGKFIHSKTYNTNSDNDSDSDSDSDSDGDTETNHAPLDDRVKSHIPKNQSVINFLYRCRAATNNKYKQKAYDNAINEIRMLWCVINPSIWTPNTIGESIEYKIREFLDGVPEDDIINA